jgi:hypothetical protein
MRRWDQFCRATVKAENPMPKICIYCGQGKPEEEFTLEHIWPDALGGDLLPALFQTNDVCQRCNNLAGLFVDGAFLKSWLGQAERATSPYDYLDLDINLNSVTPLNYMGCAYGGRRYKRDVDRSVWNACHSRPG